MQVSSFGTLLLIAALLASGAAAVSGLWPRPGRKQLAVAGAGSAAAAFSVLSAFLLLMSAYAATDLGLKNVYLNSHSLKPFVYKLTGTWGNHEGSLLLWLLILSGFGAAMAFTGRGERVLRQRALGVQGLLAFAFLAFTIFTSSPFEPYPADWPAPADGRGLNPLLQDPGLAIHPPTLYLGYVGLSAVYSFTIAALLGGGIDRAWARAVRPFLLFTWAALTLGIGLGAYWAYYELGWGGFWFWDPVENASLMPWLAATALLHCVLVVERRDALKPWCAALAIIAFGASLLGAFLVRSGIITSVHAFANDPERGVVLLLLSVLFTGGGFVLFALRGAKLSTEARFEPVSREGALVVNNLLFSVLLFTVFLGTFWPTVVEVVTGSRISVGPPYYNTMTAPVALGIAVALAFGLLVPWKSRGRLLWRRPLLTIILSGLGAAAVLSFAIGGGVFAVLGFAASIIILCAVATDVMKKGGLPGPSIGEARRRLSRVGARGWAAVLAHAGLGVILLGITGSSLFASETRALLEPGEQTTIRGLTLTYESRTRTAGRNYISETDRFVASRDGETVTALTPSRRYYPVADQATTEVGISRLGLGNLYVASAQQRGAGEARLIRAYVHPLIHLLWGGGLMLTVSGFLAAFARTRAPEPRTAPPIAAEVPA